MSDWELWFAWYPVRLYVDGDNWKSAPKVWLRWIECRIVGAVAPNGDITEYWEYRRPA